jgi:uncharacterized membrane protein
MTSRRQTRPLLRWALLLLSMLLALGLLALSLLDYAIGAHNTVAIVVALLLLGLLSILSIRVYRAGGGQLRSRTPAPQDEIPSTPALLILLALTALAAALRYSQLGQESFSYDETWTALWALRPVGSLLRAVAPLPHLVAHLCLSLGRSEFVLRLGPAFAGVLLIPAAYLLGRTLYGRRAGLIAAGLLTVSVYAIYRSQELRFYAWQMLFSTLTLYFLLRGLDRGRWRDWAGFALTTALNLYSHPYALLVLASEGLYTLAVLLPELFLSLKGQPVGARERLSAAVRRLASPATAALVALAAFGPGWGHLLALKRSPTWGVDSAPTLAGLVGTAWASSRVATWTYELPGSLLGLGHPALLWAIFALFFVGLLSSSRRQMVLSLLWFLVPPLVLSLLKVRFYYRYLSYFLPLFLLVVAHGIDTLAATIRPSRRRGPVLALLAVLVAIPNLVQIPAYYREAQIRQWREAIQFVEAHRQPGDLVLVTLNFSLWEPSEPFDWYRTVPDSELPWQFFPEGSILEDPAQLDDLPALTRGHPRVWFLFSALDPDGEPAIVAAMEDQFRLVQRQEFLYLNLVLFEARSS